MILLHFDTMLIKNVLDKRHLVLFITTINELAV